MHSEPIFIHGHALGHCEYDGDIWRPNYMPLCFVFFYVLRGSATGSLTRGTLAHMIVFDLLWIVHYCDVNKSSNKGFGVR